MIQVSKNLIATVKDFPKPGILFYDIFPLLQHRFTDVVNAMFQSLCVEEFEYVVGIESRGFILASSVAAKMGKGFIPIRKSTRLPEPRKAIEIRTEYSSDHLCMRPGCGRVVLIDDVIATGGTMRGAYDLAVSCGYVPIKAMVLLRIDIPLQDEIPIPIQATFSSYDSIK